MKKIIALLLAVVMVFAMAACGSSAPATSEPAAAPAANEAPAAASAASEIAGTYDIVVWVPEKLVDLTKSQIEAYNSSNELGIVFNATVETVSEADSATNMITDVEAGGDIYFFAQDQFARLVQAGALAKLGSKAQAFVAENNDGGSVAAVTSGEEMFAYPLTSDNGYFMYYDKSVIPAEDLGSLEKLIEDCEAAGKYFCMENETSAWYIASWFFGTGCHSNWLTDDGGNFIEVDDTFNSAKGLVAAKGMYKLLSSTCYISSHDASNFESNAAIVVDGAWDYTTIEAILGENLGCAALPSFTVDGETYHMGSFSGNKLLGVKPQTDALKQAALHQLAQYLTDETRQAERFEACAWGPSNKVVQASDAVQANPALAALAEQNNYGTAQGQIHGSWWDIAKVIGQTVKESDGSDAGLQKALDDYYAAISGLFTMSDAEKNAYSVIGAIAGTSWDTDFEMTDDGSGVWTSVDTFELKAGDEFKVRQGKSWDVNFGNGGDNFVVEADGTYTIVADANTQTITLVAAG